jgi:hypothetical protein
MELLLQRLIQLSSDLIKQLEKCKLEDIEAYMEERNLLFADLQQLSLTPDQAVGFHLLGEQIQKQDSVIIGRMTELRVEADQEIDKLNKGKRSKSMYESASYGDDSLFFDKKK